MAVAYSIRLQAMRKRPAEIARDSRDTNYLKDAPSSNPS
jgi:hypothetical protein